MQNSVTSTPIKENETRVGKPEATRVPRRVNVEIITKVFGVSIKSTDGRKIARRKSKATVKAGLSENMECCLASDGKAVMIARNEANWRRAFQGYGAISRSVGIAVKFDSK